MVLGIVRLIVMLVCFVPADTSASAEATVTFDAQSFDTTVTRLHQESGVPGLAVAVMRRGQVVFAKGYGVADPEHRAVSTETVFQVGSITKAFVALVIQQLAAEGKLELDAPVIKYLPDFRTLDRARSARITADHLVTHRSGLSTVAGNSGHVVDNGLSGPAAAVAGLASVQLFAEPGSTFQYSNANYVVLSHLIETVDQRRFEEALQARIFDPLGMQHSFVIVPPSESVHVAIPYRLWFGQPVAWTPPAQEPPDRTMIGAGAVSASIEDLATFVDAVRLRDPRVVPASADRLFALNTFWEQWGYGYGWFTRSDGENLIFEHSGFTPGFFSLAVMSPESATSVVVLTNQGGLAQGDLPRAIAHAAFNWEPIPAKAPLMARLAIWSAVMAPLGLLVLLTKTVVLLRSSSLVPTTRTRLFNAVLGLSLMACSAACYAIYPELMALSFGASWAYFPDLTLTVIVAMGMALVSGLARLALSLKS